MNGTVYNKVSNTQLIQINMNFVKKYLFPLTVRTNDLKLILILKVLMLIYFSQHIMNYHPIIHIQEEFLWTLIHSIYFLNNYYHIGYNCEKKITDKPQ